MPNPASHFLRQRGSRHQRGAAMLFAIAIIVVASLLGAAMVRMLRVEQTGVARDVLATRALLAADSASQRALYHLFASATTVANCAGANVNATTNFGSLDGLGNCSATVVCRSFTTAASSINYFSLRATGSCGPANDRATRQLEVLARDI